MGRAWTPGNGRSGAVPIGRGRELFHLRTSKIQLGLYGRYHNTYHPDKKGEGLTLHEVLALRLFYYVNDKPFVTSYWRL